MTFTKCWCHYTRQAKNAESTYYCQEQINMMFTNFSDEYVIYLLTVKGIAHAQKDDAVLKKLSKTDKHSTQLVEDNQLLCKDGKMVILEVLQNQAVSWYYRYLQHPKRCYML